MQQRVVRRRCGGEERVLGEEERHQVVLPLHDVVEGPVSRSRHARLKEAPLVYATPAAEALGGSQPKCGGGWEWERESIDRAKERGDRTVVGGVYF